jgi:hypothetical protein
VPVATRTSNDTVGDGLGNGRVTFASPEPDALTDSCETI